MARQPRRRLGRPPGTDSEETERRIIETAQRFFGEQGFERATNGSIAQEVGLTSGSIYHYFGSKADLYIAVCDRAGGLILEHLERMVAPRERFVEKLLAVLEGGIVLNEEHPSLALFLLNAQTDAVRHPQLRPGIERCLGGVTEFFLGLVHAGIVDGEIDPATNAQSVVGMIEALSVGVAHFFASAPSSQHASMIRECERLVEGTLLLHDDMSRRTSRGAKLDPTENRAAAAV